MWQTVRRITNEILGVKGSIQGMLVKKSLANIIVLFFLMEMVSKEMHQVPVQSLPFPVYPG